MVNLLLTNQPAFLLPDYASLGCLLLLLNLFLTNGGKEEVGSEGGAEGAMMGKLRNRFAWTLEI